MAGADRRKFAWAASAVALAPLAAAPWAAERLQGFAFWALAGWFVTAVVGVLAGAWVVSTHGKPGNRFTAGLVGGMLARMFLALLGGAAALSAGRPAALAFAAGVIAGFVPVQLFEVVWFFRLGRGEPAGAVTEG